jgi:hypothetical protein
VLHHHDAIDEVHPLGDHGLVLLEQKRREIRHAIVRQEFRGLGQQQQAYINAEHVAGLPLDVQRLAAVPAPDVVHDMVRLQPEELSDLVDVKRADFQAVAIIKLVLIEMSLRLDFFQFLTLLFMIIPTIRIDGRLRSYR